MEISWSERYSVGNTKIDNQHKNLVKLINDLFNINKKNIKIDEILNNLITFAIVHFNEEESMFIKINYPNAEEHIQEHLNFIHKVNQFKQQFDQNNTLLSEDLIVFLQHWLFNHILVEDKKYKKYIEDTL